MQSSATRFIRDGVSFDLCGFRVLRHLWIVITSQEFLVSETVTDSLKHADVYPVGIAFDVKFDAFEVRLTSLPDGQMRFIIEDGPYTRTEVVPVVTTPIRTGVFAVSWVEANGASVVHVEDFERSMVHSYATLPNGSFLRLEGPISNISEGIGQ